MRSFFVDQLAHFIMLYITSSMFTIEYTEKYLYVLGNYRNLSNNSVVKIPEFTENQLMCVIVYIIFSVVVGYILSFVLDEYQMSKVTENNINEDTKGQTTEVFIKVESQTNSEVAIAVDENDDNTFSESVKKIGIKIGIIERMLVIIFVSLGQYAALGLILAGKSLARFEELKEKEFSEYYLLGTLLSFLFGIIGGLFIHTFK